MPGLFGYGVPLVRQGSALGLPMRQITPAQPIPVGGLNPAPAEEPTTGSQIMGLLGMMGGMGKQMGLLGAPAGGMPALDPSKAVGAGGFGAARGFDGSVNWLAPGTTLNDYMANQGMLRYGGAAAGLPVRGMGGRLGGGI